MRWGRGVLLIEKCQAIGMQQVQISGCKPWNRLGSAALVADISLALASLAAYWNARPGLDLSHHLGLWPHCQYLARVLSPEHRTESIIQCTPKENPRNSYSLGQREPDRKEIYSRSLKKNAEPVLEVRISGLGHKSGTWCYVKIS